VDIYTLLILPIKINMDNKNYQQRLKDFFAEAILDNWRMSWKAWRNVIFNIVELGVMVDHSCIENENLTLDAAIAKECFYSCRVGPAEHFTKAC
jgi:hypothetical protein